MWNERYRIEEYVYGTEPNDFLREHAVKLTGPVLSVAEGEGRNAVFLAGMGLEVVGVDGAEVGLAKGERLAQMRGVKVRWVHSNLAHYDPGHHAFNAVVSIFAHTEPDIRKVLHDKLARCLKPGGLLLLEAYTPAQACRETGGPRDPALCMSVALLREELPGFDFQIAREVEREVIEGKLHTGMASVVQILAVKASA